MSILKTLSYTIVTKKTAATPEVNRRNKLIVHLQEQLGMARAEISGTTYIVKKRRWELTEDGRKLLVERDKRLKKWYSTYNDGTIVLTIRWGSKLLEIERGKAGIVLADITTMIGVLEGLIAAVDNGELDTHIAKANAARTIPKKKVA